MAIEVTIVVKDSEKTLRKKFLEYNAFTMHAQDLILKGYIAETVTEFMDEPDDVIVQTKMVLQ